MKKLVLILLLSGFGFNLQAGEKIKRGVANFDEFGGQGCYTGAEGKSDGSGTFCVYFGAGPDGAKCRLVIPLNEEVAKTLKAAGDDKEVCLYGSSTKAGYYIYKAVAK